MPKPFDILDQLGKFAQLKNVSLNATDLRGAFSEYVAVEVDKALGDPILLHGQRTEAMFEALLLSLSKFKLLKREDIGQVYPHNHFIAPDFRVVLENGAQWLIEVKNVYESDASKQSRTLFGQDYYRQLNGYADAVGGELKLAVFWARWSVWTLVSPAKLVDAAGNLTLDMMTAIKINEMGTLGDMMIGTTAPLTLRLTTDPDRTSPIGPDGEVKIVFGKSQIFSENREIIDPTEQQIAWIFMQYGQWEEQEPKPVIDGDRLLAMEFSWAPNETSDQGFDFVGSLSRMFARYYAEHTISEQEIAQIRAPSRLNWFAPLRQFDYASSTLPLWRFTQEPNYCDLS